MQIGSEANPHTLSEPNGILHRHLGAEVEIFYLTESQHRDRGTLVDSDENWLTLLNSKDETLMIPFSSVRIMKVLSNVTSPANLLLRPSAPDRPEGK